MSEITDLDALVPKPAKVKFEGQDITVQPPQVATVLRIADFWQTTRLASAIPETELKEAIDNLKAEICKCIPELANRELSYAQITVLVELLTKMSLPPEDEELKARKITPEETPDPKAE